MAHQLHIEGGHASMMYVGEAPWHGLGTPLQKPATAAEAIAAANLDWTVVKKPLVAAEGGRSLAIPDQYATVRQDWWESGGQDVPIFGVVGRTYTPLQNREAFDFFDDIVGQKAAIYHTAGALGHGERVWILAKLPDPIRVIGDDVADKYLLLSNSHDGSSSVQLKFTPVRVVCQNTLTMALRSSPAAVRVPHLRDLKDRLNRAETLLGIINGRFAQLEVAFQAMAKLQLGGQQLDRYLHRVFPDPPDPANEKAVARARLARRWSKHLFEFGVGQQPLFGRGSLWAAYNGVTEFVDHCIPLDINGRRRKGDVSPPSEAVRMRKLTSIWFGDGYCAKARAFEVAQQMLAHPTAN